MPDSPDRISFMEVLQIAYKHRAFLLLQFLVISVLAVTIALVIPKTYSSSATVLPPSSSEFPSVMPPEMTTGLGGVIERLTGTSGSDSNRLISILKSRKLAEQVIMHFDLMQRYKAETIEEAIESFRDQVHYTIDEEKMVRVTVHTETSFFHPLEDEIQTTQLAQDMCQFIIDYLDEEYTLLKTQKARYERALIEDRLAQSKADLQHAQLALRNFSERTGIVALPEQLEAGIAAAAKLESELLINEIELQVLMNTFSPASSEVKNKEKLVEQLRSSLNQMLTEQNDLQGVLPRLSESPAHIMEFAQLQRDITIQELIYEYLIQQYEQVKLQEARQTPTLQFIDTPQLPTDKVRPIRSLLVIIIVLLGMMLSFLYLVLKEHYQPRLRDMASSITTKE